MTLKAALEPWPANLPCFGSWLEFDWHKIEIHANISLHSFTVSIFAFSSSHESICSKRILSDHNFLTWANQNSCFLRFGSSNTAIIENYQKYVSWLPNLPNCPQTLDSSKTSLATFTSLETVEIALPIFSESGRRI